MRRLVLPGLLLALACFAQQTSSLFTVPDLTMTGSAVALVSPSSAGRYAHWCQFYAPAGNAAVVAWGDAAVSLTRGSQIAPAAGQSIPASGPVYDLSTIYFIGTSGDKVKATCQNF